MSKKTSWSRYKILIHGIKTVSRVRSLKQFSFQSHRQSLQRLWRCYRWRKTVRGTHSGNRKWSTVNEAVQCRYDDQCRRQSWLQLSARVEIIHKVKLSRQIYQKVCGTGVETMHNYINEQRKLNCKTAFKVKPQGQKSRSKVKVKSWCQSSSESPRSKVNEKCQGQRSRSKRKP